MPGHGPVGRAKSEVPLRLGGYYVPDVTLLGLGSGVSANELAEAGLGLTAVAICARKSRIALFAIIPTVLAAGGSRHPAWSGWLFGTAVLTAAGLIGVLLVTAYVRARREDFVLGYTGDEPAWAQPDESFLPYPDEPAAGPRRHPDCGDPVDPNSVRMNVLAYDFLSHVCQRDDGPALVDIHEPMTQRFLTAFTDATGLFLTEGSRDPRLLSTTIREAERRWTQVKLRLGRCSRDEGQYGSDACGPDGQ
ncbi:hypothetical protein [Pseudofrankia sp. DC12]|uniref:hypothetical protein n=1 Tax=Pseudofrankia sp. DC12 TaxID=683315 RepID=UPI000A59CAAD|nr:hypothetical protein [Pseudofrankia sp. DC12]